MAQARLTLRIDGVEGFAEVMAHAIKLMRAVEQYAEYVPGEVFEQARDFRAVLTENGFPMRRWDREDAGNDDEGR